MLCSGGGLMAQLTVYIDEVTLKRIELAAKRDHESVSKWVKRCLMSVFQNTWPKNYFELFGSLANDPFERPSQASFEKDARRQML